VFALKERAPPDATMLQMAAGPGIATGMAAGGHVRVDHSEPWHARSHPLATEIGSAICEGQIGVRIGVAARRPRGPRAATSGSSPARGCRFEGSARRSRRWKQISLSGSR